MTNHNTLPGNAKAITVEALSALLVDSVDLALLTKQAHWNIKGPRFIALHEMIDGFRSEIDGHVDTIAERIVQLGSQAEATSQAILESTRVPAYPRDVTAEDTHLKELVGRYAIVATAVRDGIHQCDDAGDPASADILTAYARALDKAVWFLEVHGR